MKFQTTDTAQIVIIGSVLEDKVSNPLQNSGNHLCYDSGSFHAMMLQQNMNASVSTQIYHIISAIT